MIIRNHRTVWQEDDKVGLSNEIGWLGMLQGTAGYPIKNGMTYCIAGGQDKYFKPRKIEFFGLNIWLNKIFIIDPILLSPNFDGILNKSSEKSYF